MMMSDDLERRIGNLESTQKEILAELNRYKGFWGGVMLVLSAVGIFIQFGGSWVTGMFK